MPDDSDITVEPIAGLPEALPQGEIVLWQGAPQTWRLARESLPLYWVLGYFALLGALRTLSLLGSEPLVRAIAAGMPFVFIGLAVGAGLVLFAWVQAKNAVYTITTDRVVMRVGAAITMNVNLPFKWIESADLMVRKDGTGSIVFQTKGEARLAYLGLWPHVRPWHMKKTEPSLRCINDAEWVAHLIAQNAKATVIKTEAAPDPAQIAAE